MFLMCNYICTVCVSSVINAAGLGIPIEIGNSPGGVSYIMISKVYYCVYDFFLVIKDGQKYNLVENGISLLHNSKGSSPISKKTFRDFFTLATLKDV